MPLDLDLLLAVLEGSTTQRIALPRSLGDDEFEQLVENGALVKLFELLQNTKNTRSWIPSLTFLKAWRTGPRRDDLLNTLATDAGLISFFVETAKRPPHKDMRRVALASLGYHDFSRSSGLAISTALHADGIFHLARDQLRALTARDCFGSWRACHRILSHELDWSYQSGNMDRVSHVKSELVHYFSGEMLNPTMHLSHVIFGLFSLANLTRSVFLGLKSPELFQSMLKVIKDSNTQGLYLKYTSEQSLDHIVLDDRNAQVMSMWAVLRDRLVRAPLKVAAMIYECLAYVHAHFTSETSKSDALESLLSVLQKHSRCLHSLKASLGGRTKSPQPLNSSCALAVLRLVTSGFKTSSRQQQKGWLGLDLLPLIFRLHSLPSLKAATVEVLIVALKLASTFGEATQVIVFAPKIYDQLVEALENDAELADASCPIFTRFLLDFCLTRRRAHPLDTRVKRAQLLRILRDGLVKNWSSQLHGVTFHKYLEFLIILMDAAAYFGGGEDAVMWENEPELFEFLHQKLVELTPSAERPFRKSFNVLMRMLSKHIRLDDEDTQFSTLWGTLRSRLVQEQDDATRIEVFAAASSLVERAHASRLNHLESLLCLLESSPSVTRGLLTVWKESADLELLHEWTKVISETCAVFARSDPSLKARWLELGFLDSMKARSIAMPADSGLFLIISAHSRCELEDEDGKIESFRRLLKNQASRLHIRNLLPLFRKPDEPGFICFVSLIFFEIFPRDLEFICELARSYFIVEHLARILQTRKYSSSVVLNQLFKIFNLLINFPELFQVTKVGSIEWFREEFKPLVSQAVSAQPRSLLRRARLGSKRLSLSLSLCLFSCLFL